MQPTATKLIPENSAATDIPTRPDEACAPDVRETIESPPRPNRIIIEAGRSAAQYWRDLWRYRELLYFLAWRDIIVHYKQTVIGVAWALIKPIVTMLVFVLVFGLLAKLPADNGVPYPLFVLAAMLPWQLFANALGKTSTSLVGNSNLISKVYFPRLILPISAVVVSLVDFVITLAVMAVMMFAYDVPLTWRIAALPLFTLLAAALALGVGLWLGALAVRYHDIAHLTPFLIQFGLYLSPVGYTTQLVPERFRLLYNLNPMVGVIDGFRWVLLGTTTLDWTAIGLSFVLVAALLVSGVWYFRKTERTFADVI